MTKTDLILRMLNGRDIQEVSLLHTKRHHHHHNYNKSKHNNKQTKSVRFNSNIDIHEYEITYSNRDILWWKQEDFIRACQEDVEVPYII